MSELRIKLFLGAVCWCLITLSVTVNGQPSCSISGDDVICYGNSTTWSGPGGMLSYIWTGPSGFSAITQDITVSTTGTYTLIISDINGTASCSGNLSVNPELLAGTINTTLRQFCEGGTAAIGGTNSPYGPATGGSGSYNYTWQLQTGCTGAWTDIPGTNMTSYTPAAPPETTCYRRKVTDLICNNEAWTDYKRFEIFEDPVSQTIVPQPEKRAQIPQLEFFHTFVRRLFLHRRKFLRSGLMAAYKHELGKEGIDAILTQLALGAEARAEQLDVSQLLQLCEAVRAALAAVEPRG